jgi:hypothetical protein
MKFSQTIKPLRRAILIASPGEESNYLYSVATDIENIRNFLLSSRGGRWREDEIITLWKPDITTVTSVIENNHADYAFVYYAGHGYEVKDDRLICLENADVSDLFLLDKSPRQLVVLDCCREKEYATISGIPKDEEWLSFDGYYPEREAFDTYILQSPPGKKIVHATKSGFASWEDKNGKGGVFTTSLLLSARSIAKEYVYSPLKIEQLVKVAKKIIRQSGDKQEPEIVYSKGNLQVPFALFIKNEVKPVYNQNLHPNIPRRVFKKETSNSDFITAGLLLLAISVIVDNSE